jgi:phosphohistidine swiveling domain-containing protein
VQADHGMSVAVHFPVDLTPAQAAISWEQEKLHFPRQMTPLTFSTLMASFMRGRNEAIEMTRRPFQVRGLRLNTYYYEGIENLDRPPNPDYEAELQRYSRELDRRWWAEHLPRLEELLAEMETLGASDLGRALDLATECWRIHFFLSSKWFFPVLALQSYFEELFPDRPAGDANLLIAGFGNRTLECSLALWRLVEAGGPSEEQLAAYLHEHGRRSDLIDIAHPAWIENPTPVLAEIEGYRADPARNPVAALRRAAAAREAELAACREWLTGYPAPVRERFEHCVADAQVGIRVSEDHNFYIDFRCTYEVRRVVLALGAALVADDRLDTVDDVFMLTLEQLQATDLRPLVAAARDEMERFRGVQPPAAVGAPLQETAPAAGDDRPVMARFNAQFWGAPPPPVPEGALAAGVTVSPGRATGRARILRSIEEAARLEPGDVLVAVTTQPPWSSIFARACAIVTDTGGALSHCAVVAREWGIPAICGTGSGTAAIADGALVTVDADAGVVYPA